MTMSIGKLVDGAQGYERKWVIPAALIHHMVGISF